MLLWRIYDAVLEEVCLGLHVKRQDFFFFARF
jgi:hypothetical protein